MQSHAKQTQNAESAHPLEMRTVPVDYIHLFSAGWRDLIGQRCNYDAVIHALVLINQSAWVLSMESVSVEILAEGKAFQKMIMDAGDIQRLIKPSFEKQKIGLRRLVDFITGADSIVEPRYGLSSSTDITPGSVLVIPNIYLMSQKKPDKLRVIVRFKIDGKTKQVQNTIRVVDYVSRIKYSMPLKGHWMMKGIPSLGVLDHHRFGAAIEFGVDFLKLGSGGELFRNDGNQASDYFSYGEKVYAAAEGEVAVINNGSIQEWSRFNQVEGETAEQFQKRQMKELTESMDENIGSWAAGNHVIIKHSENEYSTYLHLKENSIRVNSGELVKQGQHIADVGNTGDSFGAHLHFQILASPDLVYGRTLPFEFENMEIVLSEPGIIVKSL